VVIYFKSERALRYLLSRGFVYTLRGFRKGCVGRVVSVKTSRGSKAVAKAIIHYVKDVDINDIEALKEYVKHSGFESVNEWVREYRRLNGNRVKAYLYKVELVKEGVSSG